MHHLEKWLSAATVVLGLVQLPKIPPAPEDVQLLL